MKEQNARILEGHRQTMAGVVPRLYQLLSNAVEAHDARQQKGDVTTNSTSLARMEGVREVLNDASWLWVGDAFVPADQVTSLDAKLFCNVAYILLKPGMHFCVRGDKFPIF